MPHCSVHALHAGPSEHAPHVQVGTCGIQLDDIPIDCSQRVRTLSCSGPGLVTNFFADSDKYASLLCMACADVPGWLGVWMLAVSSAANMT